MKRRDFFCGHVYWMSGLGTTHWFHLALSVYRGSLLLSKAVWTYDGWYVGTSGLVDGPGAVGVVEDGSVHVARVIVDLYAQGPAFAG